MTSHPSSHPKTACATLEAILQTLNNTLSASSETHVSPLLSTLYPPRVVLRITCVTHVIAQHRADTFTDAIAILSDAGILGARFVDSALQSVTYVPGRIDAGFVGSLAIAGKVVRFSREVVVIWTGGWKVSKDGFVLFP